MSIEFFNSELRPQTIEAEVMSQAYRKARERFDSDRIDPLQFADVYSREIITTDMEYVRAQETRIESSDNRLDRKLAEHAVILEEIFADQIELNEWLGPEVDTKKASRFDDLRNGVDEIVEMHGYSPSNYLALAIDVTYGKNLEDKFNRIKDEIRRGELSTVKYFEDSQGNHKPLKKVPRVIIGVDQATLAELAKMWLERDNRSLSTHHVQIEILDEILMQLNAFRSYAIKMNKGEIVKIYDQEIAVIKKIANSEGKTEIRKNARKDYLENDKVFKAIKAETQKFAA